MVLATTVTHQTASLIKKMSMEILFPETSFRRAGGTQRGQGDTSLRSGVCADEGETEICDKLPLSC